MTKRAARRKCDRRAENHTAARYDDEISDEYLDALQRHVDAQKPEGFTRTIISEPGW